MSISFNDFQTIHGTTIPGRARKQQSDSIMLNTWWEDIQSQIAYAYDMFHDVGDEHFLLDDLHPDTDENKVGIPIKFIRHESQTYSKDPVTYWLQLQPGYECTVEYFEEMYSQKYGNVFPVGLYWDIMDESGKYNKWLCVNTANFNQNQFPTYELLRCDFLFQWLHKGKKCECPGVLQSQNSYNSGLWLDYKIQSVQDQQKFAVPLNSVTETLSYNHRMIIDSCLYNPDSEPRAWLISKVNRISPDGVARITLAQDTFDQHNDYIERDNDGNVIGMWADWFKSEITPTPIIPDVEPRYSVTAKITCSGKPQLKVGGSTKTLTVRFYNEEGEEVDGYSVAGWSYSMDGSPLSNNYISITPVDGVINKYKCKFLGDDTFVGKIITVQAESGNITATLDIEVLPL